MSLCSNCGKEMGAGTYCGSCGQRTGGGQPPQPPQGVPQYGQPQFQQPQYGQPQFQQPPYGQPQYYAPPQSAKTNGMAIAAFVLCFFCGAVLPVVFGHIAINQIKRTGEGGRGLAIAALVIGYIQLAVIVLAVIGSAAASNSGY